MTRFEISKGYLFHIDVIRVLCMIYIIFIWHLADYIGIHLSNYPQFYIICDVALGSFFFISGKLVALRNDFCNTTNCLFFYYRRFLRVFPLFFTSIITFPLFYPNITFIHIYSSLTGISSYNGYQVPTLWFISMLVSFYLISPIIAHKKWGVFLECIFYSIAIIAFLSKLPIYKRFFFFYPFYCAGIYSVQGKQLINNVYSPNNLILGGIFVALLFGIIPLFNGVIYCLLYYAADFVVALLFFQVCQLSFWKYYSKIINFLSFISFASYLFHRQIFAVVQVGLNKLYLDYALIFICMGTLLTIVLSELIQTSYNFLTRKF